MLAEHFVYHLAALEERERLAQDLHDHVAQDLVYLKIKAIQPVSCWKRENLSELKLNYKSYKRSRQRSVPGYANE